MLSFPSPQSGIRNGDKFPTKGEVCLRNAGCCEEGRRDKVKKPRVEIKCFTRPVSIKVIPSFPWQVYHSLQLLSVGAAALFKMRSECELLFQCGRAGLPVSPFSDLLTTTPNLGLLPALGPSLKFISLFN